ncbi:MAG TPA: hypothetical protein VIH26_07235 [Anaerolineales bacterium]
MIYAGEVQEREDLSHPIRRQLEAESETRSPAEHDLVLVAILNRPRDLEIARTLGWYRIPLGTAPRTVRVDWLAFYLPSAFGEQRWSVRYLAEVRGIELLTRRELLYLEADHPRAAHPYYKLQLGPLLELDPPIPSRSWRRFSFLYTTGDRLFTAVDLTQLRVPASRARERLWRMLRERTGFVPVGV